MEQSQVTEFANNFEAAQIAYARKIKTAAYKAHFTIPGFTPEDVEQELLVVLWESIPKYDPNRGAVFNTFFWMRARNRIGALRRMWFEAYERGGNGGIEGAPRTYHVDLDDDAVRAEVNRISNAPSAEDMALLKMEVQRRVAKEATGKRTVRVRRTA